jgi:hypothetical protein
MSVTLISLADLQAAEPVLREWQRIESGSAELQQYLTLFQPRAGAEFIDVSDEASSDDSTGERGQRLRLDTASLGEAPQVGKPNFSTGQHARPGTHFSQR